MDPKVKDVLQIIIFSAHYITTLLPHKKAFWALVCNYTHHTII